jgi:hypothetical protein
MTWLIAASGWAVVACSLAVLFSRVASQGRALEALAKAHDGLVAETTRRDCVLAAQVCQLCGDSEGHRLEIERLTRQRADVYSTN